MRACSKCGGSGPFYRDSSTKDGLQSRCRVCQKQVAKEHYKAHAPEVIQRVRTWQREHSVRSAQQVAQRRASEQRYVVRNKQKKNASTRRWQLANPDKTRAATKAYKDRNPDKVGFWRKSWQVANPAAFRAAQQRARWRRHTLLATGACTLTAQEWKETLEYFNHACAYCLRDDVPMTQDHVIALDRGGEHTQENVVPACKRCNSKKHNKPVFVMVATAA